MIINETIQVAIGASNFEADILNFLADTLTKNNQNWTSSQGDGSGAWGVSQKWYGIVTPADSIPMQSAQALNILREISPKLGPPESWPGLVCYYSAILRLWWFPSDLILINDWRDQKGVYPKMSDLHWSSSEASAWLGFTGSVIKSIKANWILWSLGLVGLAVGIYLVTRK